MKIELVLLIAGAAIAALLYTGLPEQAPRSAITSPAAPADADADGQGSSAAQRPGAAVTELERLRRAQSVLAQELKRLDRQINTGGMRAGDDGARTVGDDAGDAKDQPGVTIYLETGSPSAPASPDKLWTAVSFRDAGTAPDGTHQAVMTIYPDLPTSRTHPTGTYRATGSRWQ
jgi:hypothetical protein